MEDEFSPKELDGSPLVFSTYSSVTRLAGFKYNTVEHTYDACPKYSELGSYRIIAYLYVSDSSRRWQRQYSKKKVQRFYI